jgi:hypothetical protein
MLHLAQFKAEKERERSSELSDWKNDMKKRVCGEKEK